MEDNKHQTEKYVKARRRVNDMKKFYSHLRVYIIVNILLIVIKLNLFEWFKDGLPQDPAFRNWVDWNVIGTPILLGIGLLAHGLYVFKFDSEPWNEIKPKFIKDWEEKQLQKFMKEGAEQESKNR